MANIKAIQTTVKTVLKTLQAIDKNKNALVSLGERNAYLAKWAPKLNPNTPNDQAHKLVELFETLTTQVRRKNTAVVGAAKENGTTSIKALTAELEKAEAGLIAWVKKPGFAKSGSVEGTSRVETALWEAAKAPRSPKK